MDESIHFSVIIPVFNTKLDDFILCLTSIKNNDLEKSKFEVIIINDGMEDFTEYYYEINMLLTSNLIENKVVHNSLNMGLSYSRYVGLNEAKGEYVHFVDSDDEVFPHTYTTLINYLKDEPEFILFKMMNILEDADNNQQRYVFENLTNGINPDDLKDHIFCKKDMKKIRGIFCVSLPSKIFNRAWLLNNTKFWVPNLYMEDVLLLTEILLKSKKFKVCLDKLYKYYYLNTGSITNSKNNKLFFDATFVYDKVFSMITIENGLRHLIIDNFLGFYAFYSKNYMVNKFDFFFLEILGKYDNINFKFMNKKHYQWFKKDEKLKKLFSQYILSKEDLFFSDSLGIGEETIIPQDKAEKGKKLLNKNFNLDESMPQLRIKYEALNNEGQVDNLDSVLESLFLSTLIFTLTKFVYSKEIFITKLYRDNKKSTDLFERITFAYDVDTSIVCQNFLRDVKKYDMKVMEYRDYFQDCFKDYNDVIFPDFQFYYKQSSDDFRESEVPESNFTVIFDDYMMRIFYNGCCYSDDLVDLFFNSFKIVLDIFVNDELETLSNISLSNIFISSKNICKDDIGKDDIGKEGLGKNYKNGFISSSQTTVIKTFNEIVDNYEDKYALVAVDRSLTFNDLDLESNIIANELIKRGLRKGDKVLIV
ncbi:MAG: glycosyltransferase, partial [Methanobrevibacter sp.]|nr:glycosyltransferase [Candidatus Methanovirga procula]